MTAYDYELQKRTLLRDHALRALNRMIDGRRENRLSISDQDVDDAQLALDLAELDLIVAKGQGK